MTHWLERTELLLGSEKTKRLQNARVLVVGLGGVGAYAAEMLARSGIGAYHGWDGGNPALPPMYESISYYRDKTAPWAFSRQADIVVINLGTNDLWTGGWSPCILRSDGRKRKYWLLACKISTRSCA